MIFVGPSVSLLISHSAVSVCYEKEVGRKLLPA